MTETTTHRVDEEALAGLAATLQQAWNAGDGDAFAAAFWDDAEFTVFDGFAFTGRQAIAHDHVWAFTEGPRKGSRAAFRVTSTRALGDDVALVKLVAVIDGKGRDGSDERHIAVPRAIAQRRDGEWRLLDFTNLLLNPIPPAHHPANRAFPQPGPQD